ncbi:MAG: carboxypeptidase-like regulatory domain-containing protein, partial [Planctomycetota bacterium]
YTLAADYAGFAPQRLDGLVLTNRELQLDSPIELHRPLTLGTFLDPPVDPYGQPWSVELMSPEPYSLVSRVIAAGEAAIDGSWEQPGLSSGTFRIRILDHQSSVWLEQAVELHPGTSPFFLEIPVVRVEGSIRSGDEPLEAKLLFGGSRVPHVVFTANEQGHFEGYLPTEGEWPVELIDESHSLEQALAPVDVKVRPGRGIAFVDIELPGTQLAGEVVRRGEPVAGASLAMIRRDEEKPSRAAILYTDENGEFLLHGLEPGLYNIQARDRKAESVWQAADLRENLEHPKVRLVLEEKIEISGIVLAGRGVVAGAQVIAIPAGGEPSMAFSERRTAGADGTFELSLPASADAAELLVIAPGLGLIIRRIALPAAADHELILDIESGGGRLVLAADAVTSAVTSTLSYGDSTLSVSLILSNLASAGVISEVPEGLAIDGMPPGPYRLCETPSASRCGDGYLAPSGHLVLSPPAGEATEK